MCKCSQLFSRQTPIGCSKLIVYLCSFFGGFFNLTILLGLVIELDVKRAPVLSLWCKWYCSKTFSK